MKTAVCSRRVALKGIYILTILIDKSIAVKVGAMGKIFFTQGFYAYVGSAQNSLEKRLNRHFKKAAKKKFWHIDYLLTEKHVNTVKAFFKEAEKSEECITAQRLGEIGVPVEGFGCSDCNCKSHLFMFSDRHLLENACLKLGFKPLALSCQ
ncbi:DUF123 domain-containing protein [Candidatus Bathyarchaeota archaeon]|nr:MAG: DUF123 domain-containing protein [Candidatus Bathyarchaeota archaeon]